jgi:hypothetical protein
MSSVVISGDTSGTVSIAAPAVAGSNTLTLQAATATNSVNTLSTVNAGGTNPFPSSGGPTSVDFTLLPSWVKKITVMFSGVSLSSTANFLLQVGTGGTPTSTGYASSSIGVATAGAPAVTSTSGYIFYAAGAAGTFSGIITIANITGNTWVANGVLAQTTGTAVNTIGGGTVTLGGVMNILRITTTSTDTFDAGSINILYEG